jgi:hypothetical protein
LECKIFECLVYLVQFLQVDLNFLGVSFFFEIENHAIKTTSVNMVHNAPVEIPPAQSFPLPTPVLYPVDPPPRPSHFPLGFFNLLIPPLIPLLYIINFPLVLAPPRPSHFPLGFFNSLTPPPPCSPVIYN